MNWSGLAAGVVAAWVVLGGHLQAQPPTFTTQAHGVRLDVLVTEGGRPIGGLNRGDFEVADNGIPQVIDSVVDMQGAHVVLVLDTSSSVTGERLAALAAAARTVMAGVTERDRATLLTVSGDIRRVELPRSSALAAAAAGSTSLYDAILTASLLSFEDTRPTVAMVLTDGLDTSSWLTASELNDVLRRRDVVIYPVLVGATANRASGDSVLVSRMDAVRRFAETTGGRVLDVDTHTDFPAAVASILDEYRQRYMVTFTPTDDTPGLHRLQLRVRGRRTKVTMRQEYWRRPS